MNTKSMNAALNWLNERGGNGVRQGRGRTQVLCAGEVAPFYWMTFKQLIATRQIKELPNWRIEVVKEST